ncbi:hypothetical protein J6590_064456 [Homalodisca vitripennis]|nr:hypothetical protein J6590_064456 [Homalodisca vitripennis]
MCSPRLQLSRARTICNRLASVAQESIVAVGSDKSPGHNTSGERRALERHRSATALQSGPICSRANVKRGVTIDLSGERQ